MKTISLKITLLVIGIFVLSGCYTQLSEPISREEYYTEEEYDIEPDTVYQYQEAEVSEYNLGYRDGSRDFMKEYLWYGYNPDSYFYSGYRPSWNSNWGYNHSFYLGVYDPYFYDPFWDWGYYGSYSPYSYYGYSNSYYHPYSRHPYNHSYYYQQPYYHHGGYAGTKKVSEGREQLSANRQPASSASSASRASRAPVSNNSDFQSTMNLPMAAGRGNISTVSTRSQNNAENLMGSIPKSGRATRNVQTLDVQSTKSPDEAIPGFQTTLVPPVRPGIRSINTRSTSNSRARRTVTMPVKKSSSSKNSRPSSKSSAPSSSGTKSDSGSSSSSSSGSSYRAPAKSSSSSSSSNSSSGTRSSSSRSSNSSSSRSSSSKSSSSDRSSKKNK